MHKELLRGVSEIANGLKRGFESSVRGTNESLPKRVRTEWHEVAISDSIPQCNRIKIDLGQYPKLAKKFPQFTLHAKGLHHVEAAKPT